MNSLYTKLAVRETGPGRIALVDLDRGAAPIPYPIVVNTCSWGMWGVPSGYGIAGSRASTRYGEGRKAKAAWALEHAGLMRHTGISAAAMYVDVDIWAQPDSGLWGWPVLVPSNPHRAELAAAARAGDIIPAIRLLEDGRDELLLEMGRHGLGSADVVAICGWNELCWHLLLEGVAADTALDWSTRVLAATAPRLDAWFPGAVRVLDRIAGSLRKDRPAEGWVGRRYRVEGREVERSPDDPTSHYWRYVRAAHEGADALALNCYSDDPGREKHRLDLVHAALVGWGHRGAIVVSESHWAISRGWPHRLLWAQYAYPGAPRWTYPWGGTAAESAALYGAAIRGDVARGYVIASSIYGWAAHGAHLPREPLGAPWGPVIPAVPGEGLREYRDIAWMDAMRLEINQAREDATR